MDLQDEASTTADVKEDGEAPLKHFRRGRWMRRRPFKSPKSRVGPSGAAAAATTGTASNATVAAPDAKGAASEATGAVGQAQGAAPEATRVAAEATETAAGATGAAAEVPGAAEGKPPGPSGDGVTLPPTAPEVKEEKPAAAGGDEASGGAGPKEPADDPVLPPPKRKSRFKAVVWRVVWRAALFAILLAMLTVGGRRLLLPAGPLARGPPLISNPKEVQTYEKALSSAASELKRLWERVSPEVRQSFYTHYTPRVYGSSSLTSPLELFERQVSRVFERMRPPLGASSQQYGVYVQQLQIARVILKAAWTRLSQLQALEEFVVSRKGGEEDRYSFQTPVLPGGGMGSAGEELLSFRDFLDLLGSRKGAVPAYPDATARRPTVPLALAQGLARALQMLEFQAEMDAKVHRAFHELLLVTGTPLPCGPLQPLEEFAKEGPLYVEPRRPFFPASFFSYLLAAFSRESSTQLISDDALSTWAYQWTYEGAAQRLAELGERMNSNFAAVAAVKVSLVSRWAVQQPHDPAATTDLTCLAFSLL